jgi:hypothetical protein
MHSFLLLLFSAAKTLKDGQQMKSLLNASKSLKKVLILHNIIDSYTRSLTIFVRMVMLRRMPPQLWHRPLSATMRAPLSNKYIDNVRSLNDLHFTFLSRLIVGQTSR